MIISMMLIKKGIMVVYMLLDIQCYDIVLQQQL